MNFKMNISFFFLSQIVVSIRLERRIIKRMAKIKYFQMEFWMAWLLHTNEVISVEEVTRVLYSRTLFQITKSIFFLSNFHLWQLWYQKYSKRGITRSSITNLNFFLLRLLFSWLTLDKSCSYKTEKSQHAIGLVCSAWKMPENVQKWNQMSVHLERRISNAEQIKSYYFNSIARISIGLDCSYFCFAQLFIENGYVNMYGSFKHRHTHHHEANADGKVKKKNGTQLIGKNVEQRTNNTQFDLWSDSFLFLLLLFFLFILLLVFVFLFEFSFASLSI